MKSMKSYRFNEVTMLELKELKERYPEWTETEIVEKAIDLLNLLEVVPNVRDSSIVFPVRLMSGQCIYVSYDRKMVKKDENTD